MTTLDSVLAVVSLLHEPADLNSATRLFRDRPVLSWTLERLSQATSVDGVTILCWSDQSAACGFARDTADVIDLGPRNPAPAMTALTAARKWSDGWRSGLLGSCDFDLGFDAVAIEKVLADHDADAALLVDPASALVDPQLIEQLIADAQAEPSPELFFTQAAPGLSGVLIRREMIARLAIAKVHPGRLLTYHPDQHGVDPIGKPGCCPVPTTVARTTDRFKLDSTRQIQRFDEAFGHLNGHLRTADAQTLVSSFRGRPADDSPRELTIEVNTVRASSPIYWPGHYLSIDRPEMTVELFASVVADAQLSHVRPARAGTGETPARRADDLRLTLGGVGDPLSHPQVFDLIAAAKSAGVASIHVETDLLCDTATVDQLAASAVDVVTVFIPAATATTYQTVMNVDGFSTVMANIDRLQKLSRGTPIISVTYTKLPQNLSEMEPAYDYWVRRFGHAVISGPADYAGQIPDTSVADMSPPKRTACRRLSSRMHVLSDGQAVSCDQDVIASDPLGSSPAAWSKIQSLNVLHHDGEWNSRPLCAACREWHRP